MRARIFMPARPASSSGYGRSDKWVLEYPREGGREIDPLMGWTSTSETQYQVQLAFDTKEEALAYASAHGVDAVVMEPKLRKPNIRPAGYGENFATNRRGTWTH
jgi:hypothetical protein